MVWGWFSFSRLGFGVGFFFCLNQGTSGNKDLPVRCVSKGSHQHLYKGQRKERPKELVQKVGIPLAGFAGNAGTEWVVRGLPPPQPPKGISPRAVARGDASAAGVVGWAMRLSPLLPLPAGADPFSGVARPHRRHRALPTGVREAHGDTRHIPYTGMLRHQCVHMDTCPPGRRSRRHGLSACWTAAAPRLPPAASQEPVPHSTVRAGSGSIASGSRVPQGPGSQCGGEPSQARWALTGTGGDNASSHGAALGRRMPCVWQSRQRFLPQGCLGVPAVLRRSRSAHLPTSLNQGKRS